MRPAAILLAVALAACGEEERPRPGPAAGGDTRLEVVVRPQGDGGPVERRVITDVPARLKPRDFAPVPAATACTEIYGGPATATVTGSLDGEPIRATFNRTNGCEIARWDRLRGLLGDVPGAQPPP